MTPLKVLKKEIVAFDCSEYPGWPIDELNDGATLRLIAISESVYGISACLFLVDGELYKITKYCPQLFEVASYFGLDNLKK